jgi:hypothetical protein
MTLADESWPEAAGHHAWRPVEALFRPADSSKDSQGGAAFAFRGDFYLAIANEVPAIGATTSNTTPTGWIEQSTEQGGRAEGAELTDRRAVDR